MDSCININVLVTYFVRGVSTKHLHNMRIMPKQLQHGCYETGVSTVEYKHSTLLQWRYL